MKPLKENYPKSWEKLKEYLTNELIELTNRWRKVMPEGVAVDFPKIEPISDTGAEGMIQFYPRRLYDFFDAQELPISIQQIGKNKDLMRRWQYDIGEEVYSDYTSRVQVEEKAWDRAFEILEGKL